MLIVAYRIILHILHHVSYRMLLCIVGPIVSVPQNHRIMVVPVFVVHSTFWSRNTTNIVVLLHGTSSRQPTKATHLNAVRSLRTITFETISIGLLCYATKQ